MRNLVNKFLVFLMSLDDSLLYEIVHMLRTVKIQRDKEDDLFKVGKNVVV